MACGVRVSRGFGTYLQPKAPAPMMRMEEGAGDSGGLGEDMLVYGTGVNIGNFREVNW